MDWIEFVSKHSGSPFAPKMRHHNIGIGSQTIVERVEEGAGTLASWLKRTEEKIRLQNSIKIGQINALLVVKK